MPVAEDSGAPSESSAAAVSGGPAPPPPATARTEAPPKAPLIRRLWPVIAIAVAAVVVVAAFAVLLSGGGSPGGTGGRYELPYSTTVGRANAAAANTTGGPWSLVAATGAALAAEAFIAANNTVGAGCALTSPGGGSAPTTLYIPAFSGSLSAGTAPWWGFIYYDSTTQSALLVDVENGTAEAVLVATGACTTTFQGLSAILPAVVDSSVAAKSAWNSGGSTFAAAYSNTSFNMFLLLLGGGSVCALSGSACWAVEYTPCDPFAIQNPLGSQPTFTAVVDALSGTTVLVRVTTATCASSSTIPLGTVLGLGSAQLFTGNGSVGCAAGDYCESVAIASAAGGIAPANFTLKVDAATGGLASGVLGFSIVGPTGLVVVRASGNPSGPWASGSGTSASPLSSTMTIVVDFGSADPAGAGDVLVATGVGSYSGTVSVSLP